jgi:hypothetical protein
VLANSRSDQVGLSALASRRSFSLTAKSRTKNPPIAEERVPHHGQQGADPGDHRQAARRPFDPTSELTFKARVTSRGARNSRLG